MTECFNVWCKGLSGIYASRRERAREKEDM